MVTIIEEINQVYYKDLIYIDIHVNICMYSSAKKSIYGNL